MVSEKDISTEAPELKDLYRKMRHLNHLNRFNFIIFSLFFITFLSFLIILIIMKFKNGDPSFPDIQNGPNVIEGNDGSSLIKSIPIYIGILSFFFTIFIFIFQTYIKILLDSMSKVPEIIKMNTVFEISKEFEKKNEMYDEKQKELIKSMAELIRKPQELTDIIEENKKYYESNSRRVFQIANQFLDNERQVPVSSMFDLLDLWDEGRAQYAVSNLRGANVIQALPFLRERFEYYNKYEFNQIARDIKEAIDDLEKKVKE